MTTVLGSVRSGSGQVERARVVAPTLALGWHGLGARLGRRRLPGGARLLVGGGGERSARTCACAHKVDQSQRGRRILRCHHDGRGGGWGPRVGKRGRWLSEHRTRMLVGGPETGDRRERVRGARARAHQSTWRWPARGRGWARQPAAPRAAEIAEACLAQRRGERSGFWQLDTRLLVRRHHQVWGPGEGVEVFTRLFSLTPFPSRHLRSTQ